MQTCTHKTKNGLRCHQPVLTKSDKSIPSERIVMPGKYGEFIYLHTQRKPISDLCYYHQMLKDQKQFEKDHEKETRHTATLIIDGK